MTTPDACPVCASHRTKLEAVRGGWMCNGCGYAFGVNDVGKVIWWSPTNHSKDRPPPRRHLTR